MKKILIACTIGLCILFLNIGTSFSGEIYKWVDENGVVHFSDSLDKNPVSKERDVKPRWFSNDENEGNDYEKRRQELGEENIKVKEYNAKIEEDFQGSSESVEEAPVIKDRVLSKKEYQQSFREVEERNARIREQNALILKQNERLKKEYEKKLKEIEEHNTRIAERNEEIRKENEEKLGEYEKKKQELEEKKAQKEKGK